MTRSFSIARRTGTKLVAIAAALVALGVWAPPPAGARSAAMQQKLPAPDGAPTLFGASVSLSADAGVALIAAPDSIAGGSAFVFLRSGSGWIEQQELPIPHGLGNPFAVSLSADGRTALLSSSGTFSEHAAYVFVRGFFGRWNLQQRLQAGGDGDGFGDSLSLSPDARTAVIGAPFADGGKGATYVFTRGFGGSFTLQQTLHAQPAAADDRFGSSVSLDATGSTALIGAPGTDESTGAAYVFARGLTGGFTSQQTLQAQLGAAGDSFGFSVALESSGRTALIGAPAKDGDSGAAYVFNRGLVGSFSQRQALQGAAGDVFGLSVSLGGSGLRALIGAPGNDNFAGAAYVFARTLFGGFAHPQQLAAEQGAGGDNFGLSVSLSAVRPTALVGAPATDALKGAAYVFSGQLAPFAQDGRLLSKHSGRE